MVAAPRSLSLRSNSSAVYLCLGRTTCSPSAPDGMKREGRRVQHLGARDYSEVKAELHALLHCMSEPTLKQQTSLLGCPGYIICSFSLVSRVSLRPTPRKRFHDCLSSLFVMHFYTFLDTSDRDHPRLQHLPIMNGNKVIYQENRILST